MSFLLRVEGVNFAEFIYDTQDLSTIRGGGLLLLDVALTVEDKLKQLGCNCKLLMRGASTGLFRVTTGPPAHQVRDEVERHVAATLPHATFVTDVYVSDVETPSVRATVQAMNRWRQMQAPSVVYPALGDAGDEAVVCEIDHRRPACHHVQRRGDNKIEHLSAATFVRRQYGRDAKRHFYDAETSLAQPDPSELGAPSGEYRHSWDFDELCGASAQWGNLKDKMALLYLDGNSFGHIARSCQRDDDARAFSTGLRGEQAGILRALLHHKIYPEHPTGAWWNSDEGTQTPIIRLETLLWGGDEIIWVVPAWKGWELLEFFFEQSSRDPRPDWSPVKAECDLTYTAALVFCHTTAPIHDVRQLAHDLADVAKKWRRPGVARTTPGENRFVYQVLESFDYIAHVDAATYLPLTLPATAVSTITGGMPLWRDAMSRKQLHRAVKLFDTAWALPDGNERQRIVRAANEEAGKIMETLARVNAEAHTALGQVEEIAGDRTWAHILELWDYVQPISEPPRESAAPEEDMP